MVGSTRARGHPFPRAVIAAGPGAGGKASAGLALRVLAPVCVESPIPHVLRPCQDSQYSRLPSVNRITAAEPPCAYAHVIIIA